jgi:bile acid:Na+ symporter, BASS family
LVMPLVALALLATLDLKPPVAIAIATLLLSPIPPMLPRKELKSGAGASYVFSLLVTVAILAVVQMPVGVDLISRLLGHPARVSPGAVAQIIAVAVLAPLIAGMAVNVLAPAYAEKLAQPLSRFGTVLLVVCVLPVLVVLAPLALSLIGGGTLLAIGAFINVGLATGHLLGGPLPRNRIVLALSTASRHPGVALAVAVDEAPEKKLVIAAIVLYLVLNAILSAGYLAWARPRAAGGPSEG